MVAQSLCGNIKAILVYPLQVEQSCRIKKGIQFHCFGNDFILSTNLTPTITRNQIVLVTLRNIHTIIMVIYREPILSYKCSYILMETCTAQQWNIWCNFMTKCLSTVS